jgi:hypothetical protein
MFQLPIRTLSSLSAGLITLSFGITASNLISFGYKNIRIDPEAHRSKHKMRHRRISGKGDLNTLNKEPII